MTHVHQSEILQLDLTDLPKGETPGQAITKNWSFKVMCAKQIGSRAFEAELAFPFTKAVFTEVGDSLSGIPFSPGVFSLPVQQPFVWQLMPRTPITAATVNSWKESGTYINLSDTAAENSAAPDVSNFSLSVGTIPVRRITVLARASDELLDDLPVFGKFLDDRLVQSVLLKLDTQIISGNGTSPNLLGLLSAGITSIAKSALSRSTALLTALSRCRSLGLSAPDAIILHPTDSLALQTDLASTSGDYLIGPPAQFASSAQPVWTFAGTKVLITTAISQGTALVGDFATGAQLFVRKDVFVDSTASDASWFTKNVMTFRANLRAALLVTSPLRFCAVTGF